MKLFSQIRQADSGWELTVQNRPIGTWAVREHAERVRAQAVRNAVMLSEYSAADLALLADVPCAGPDQHRRLGELWKDESEGWWLSQIVPAIRRGATFEFRDDPVTA